MNPASNFHQNANILLVDDAPDNLRLLAGMLKARGYKPRPVTSGRLALEAARACRPDLVLLDINMPEMNGYEVCAAFKADPRLDDVPILFISAVNETEDKVRAFRAGCVDFVPKPFQLEEVEARVRTHLELAGQRRQLEQNYQQLQNLEKLRDNLTHMIVHDMRSPLFVLQMMVDSVAATRTSDADELEEVLTNVKRNVQTLTTMADQMLDVSRLEAGQMPLNKTRCNLIHVIRTVMDELGSVASGKTLSMMESTPVFAVCDQNIVGRVITNLLSNALKVTSRGGEVRVGVTPRETDIHVVVIDSGPGITQADQARIFEKFGRLNNTGAKGVGLGLAFCKLAVAAHGGTIGVDSGLKRGSSFWFTLPLAC